MVEINNKKKDLFEMLSKIATSFTSLNRENIKVEIEEALSLLGNYLEVDKTYIYKYNFECNIATNTYQWYFDRKKSVKNKLETLSLENISSIVEEHKKGLSIYILNSKETEKADKISKHFNDNGILTAFIIPLIFRKKLYGFVGFNSTINIRKYTEKEQLALLEFSKILVSTLMRVELEQDIFEQNEKLDFILEVSEIGTWEWNLKTDDLIVNDQWLNIVGYKRSDLEPITIDTWKNLLNKKDKKQALEQLDNVIKHNTEIIYEPEFRMNHKDGHSVWVKDRGKVTRRENGVPIYMIGTHIDITKSKNREVRLESQIHAIDSTPVGVTIMDHEGKITFVNPTFLKLLNKEASQVTDFNSNVFAYELESGEKFDGSKGLIWDCINSGKEWHGTIISYDGNNNRLYIDAKISPVYSNTGTITSFIGILNDVTKEKNSERKLKVYRDALEDRILVQNINLEDSQKATVFALAKLTEARDADTGNHIGRVQHLCEALAIKLQSKERYKKLISDDFVSNIYHASVLHDIGKIKIPDKILLKPDKLTDEEFNTMKQHVKFGSETLEEMIVMYPDNAMIIMGAKIAKYHHEKWDGKGYLEGLSGTDIPLAARIMALVDAYDAIRSIRPYKEEISHKKAVEIIKKDSGTHFDPEIVRAFLQINEEFELIYDTFNEIDN